MRLRRNRRRGMILLIVLVMLTLFAIAGLTFVLYAEAASESARFNKDAETYAVSNAPDMDPTQSLDLFLGQLIYGVADPTAANTNSGSSALRGHSLAETMYGSYDSNGNAPYVPSDVPYNGTGRLSEPGLYSGTDGNQLVNYMYFQSNIAGYDPTFLRDPSRPGSRTSAGAARTTYTGGQNAPYTYPDTNSMFLASVSPSTGQVTIPSYYRQSLFDPNKLGASNPNWTSPQGKYMTLRPRPNEMGPTFPMPDPTTGCDVKNISGLSGGNDSIWIDIGAPELYTASGLRYKMLVAPLVLDLDRAINLNVVGNVFAEGQPNRHAGNQGWGQWEVNMSRVLNAPTAPNEWENVFFGNGAVSGRYGSGTTALPASVFPLGGSVPHVYAQGDLNGVIDSGNPNAFTTGAGQQWSLPIGMSCFPIFPSVTYDNAGAGATLNSGGQSAHPMFYNPMNPTGPNRLLPLWSHATLMYAGAAASQNGDLSKVCPTNFNPTDPNTLKRIYETTLLSMDLDRSGASPYFYDPNNSGYQISYNPKYVPSPPTVLDGWTYTASAQTFPLLTSRGNTPAYSEFDPRTWRSVLPAMLSRIDLDRNLTPYTGPIGNPVQADADRKQFALDIFTRLLAVTGMTGVNANLTSNPAAVSPPQYNTLRFLAQLSANIVDYIDTDDVMTEFNWTSAPQSPDTTGIVFGTELPKLVVNEVYLEYDNDSGDPNMIANPNPPPAKIQGATQSYHMNVWTELVNPLPSAADPNAPPNGIQVNNDAKLVNGNGAVYQLVITKPNVGLRNPDNTVGNPDATPPIPPNAPYTPQPYGAGTGDSSQPGQVLAVVNTWGTVQSVTPMGTTPSIPPGAPPAPGTSSQGYLVLGPTNPGAPLTAAQQVQLQPSIQANNMTYKVANPLTSDTPPTPPTILLQRLANPNVAFNAATNPYVTVDYIDTSLIAKPNAAGWYPVVNDARPYNFQGTNPNFVTNPNNRFSYGRMEPYAAGANLTNANPTNATGNQWRQQAVPPANPNLPETTFFAVNNPAPPPPGAGQPSAYHWLVHMDRPLVSPIELLNVSGFKPHELTQQFIDANGLPYAHVAPWTDLSGSSRLYRLLEFVKMKNPTPGIVNGGRIPGRVNINTIDPNATEVFEALCDAEPGNLFYDASSNPNGSTKVDQVFSSLMAQRSNPNQGPFLGMAQGAYKTTPPPPDLQYPNGAGLTQTLLSGAANVPGATHPYQQLELLNKLYNNTTTRSNVFAVWLTVGFFQITDDTTQPMKLGPEINVGQGKNIRHHMFAIVDRTQIQTWQQGTLKVTTAVGPGASPTLGFLQTTVTDPRTGVTWTIQAATPTVPGSMLVYDPGQANEETVEVQAGYSATFQYAHNQGAIVISRGHPGPWNLPGVFKYDVTQDAQVVPYWVIID